jgi:iron complex outermembrane receptor protein
VSKHRTTNDSSIVPIVTNGIGSAFRVRSNLVLGWERGNFGVSWTARYFSGVKERCWNIRVSGRVLGSGRVRAVVQGARNYNERGSVTFHDVQVRYSLPWDATVSVGANNVFEKTGPVMYSKPNSAFSYYGGYDIGRFIYMKYQQRF